MRCSRIDEKPQNSRTPHRLQLRSLHDQEIWIFYETARIKADQVRNAFYFCSFYKNPMAINNRIPQSSLSLSITTFFPAFRENFLTFPRPLSAGNADKTTHK